MIKPTINCKLSSFVLTHLALFAGRWRWPNVQEFENDFELDLVLLDQGEWKVPVPVGALGRSERIIHSDCQAANTRMDPQTL